MHTDSTFGQCKLIYMNQHFQNQTLYILITSKLGFIYVHAPIHNSVFLIITILLKLIIRPAFLVQQNNYQEYLKLKTRVEFLQTTQR